MKWLVCSVFIHFILHLQDLALEFYIVAESFETSVPWDKCEQLCRNTKLRVSKVMNAWTFKVHQVYSVAFFLLSVFHADTTHL